MCGIIGYIGEKQAAPILIEGLKALEYRGYDSAGFAAIAHVDSGTRLSVYKTAGKVAGLERYHNAPGTIAIGHTRWATHGEPTWENAHPHRSGDVAVVHNGIIENHAELRRDLQSQGCVFRSDTDTEVLPHLIVREQKVDESISLEAAVARALARVEGAYAIAVVSEESPNLLVVACKSSPLVIGIGEQELYVASDELALAGKVSGVVAVHDGAIVTLRRNGSYTFLGAKRPHQSLVEKPAVVVEVSKGAHAHYMHKEIFEQPQAMRNVLAGRLHEEGPVTLGGLAGGLEGRMGDARRIVLAACGTSLFAAMAGKPLFERWAGMLCDAEQAAEFAYREPILSSRDVVIGISQSGETADTLKAIALAKERRALTFGITNRVNSALAKRAGAGMYLHAGPEVAVASTKAFTSQVAALALLALRLAQVRGRTIDPKIVRALQLLPQLVEDALAQEPHMRAVAEQHKDARRMIIIGRGSCVPLAMEAALKIREVAYIDAHGLSSAELKHGTLALVERGTPVVALMPSEKEALGKMRSSLEEVKARGGEVIPLEAPSYMQDELLPILLAPSVQLLAYHLGVARGIDVDRPRNLAKSVTVE